MSPKGRYSCIAQGASPGFIVIGIFIEPQRGGTFLSLILALLVPLLKELILLLSVCTQGFILGFALIAPWAMKSIVPTALIIRLNFDAVALLALP